MLGGRVKTLHPKVHGGILFQRGKAEDRKQTAEHSIVPIDLVVVNLYPFSATAAKPGVTPEELIENIDIGGPAMVRSAAKNFQSVGVITDPARLSGDRRGAAREARIEPGDAPGAGAQGLRADVALRRRNRHGTRTPRGKRRSDARPARKIAGANSRGAGTPPSHALRRKSAPGRGALRSRGTSGGGSRGREAAAGQGAFLQQSGGSRCRGGAGQRVSASGGRDHQAQQSVRRGGAGIAARRLSEGARVRSGIGLRRRAGVQPRDRRGNGGGSGKAVRRMHRRAGL